ncbi:MAG: hypothetical protein V3W41_03720 [Planctomycetota bacterium]
MVQTKKRQPQAGGASKALDSARSEPKRPILYLDIIGTLVLQEGSSFRVVPFAKEFVREIADRFQLVFMTELSRGAAREVADLLEMKVGYGDYRKGLGKVSGIDFTRPFLWVDDAPGSRDLMRLAEERCSGCLITVNGKDGVSRATLNKVEACLRELQPAPS